MRCFVLFLTLLLLAVPGCSRGPANATEAKAKLPRIFTGSVTFDGERAGRRVRVLTDALRVRDDRTLEFQRVHFYVLAPLGDDVIFDEIVEVRGTVTVPGLDVRIEDQGALGRVAGDPIAVRPGTFRGQLGADLQTATAEWRMTDPNTGQERRAELKLKALR